MGIRVEVIPFLALSAGIGLVAALLIRLPSPSWTLPTVVGGLLALGLGLYMLYFFRDPERTPPQDSDAVLAPADGRLESIRTIGGRDFLDMCLRSGLKAEDIVAFGSNDVTRFSIFLSLVDVHVNRAPIGGVSRYLGYFPGKRLFTFDEKSSEANQHNAIIIENKRTCSLIYQIVGPVCRRVVYWPDHKKPVTLKAGDRIGMMKFGSRLDLYFPAVDVEPTVVIGDNVRAGETVLARLKRK